MRHEENGAPNDPPNAIASREVRQGAWWLYVFPLIVACVVAAVFMAYWMSRDASDDPAAAPIGTAGEPTELRQEGGGDPAGRPGNTANEVEQRAR